MARSGVVAYYQPGYVEEEVIGRSSSPFTQDEYTIPVDNQPNGSTCGSCGTSTETVTEQSSSQQSSNELCRRCFTWWILAFILAFLLLCFFGSEDDDK